MSKDLVADAINKIKICDRVGKQECTVKYSKLLENVLKKLAEKGYISSYEYVEDQKGGQLRVFLNGKIKEMGVIKPRAPVKRDEWFAIEARYLPAVGYGCLIVTTPQGVITNEEAREKKIGGRLIAYVY